MNDDRRRTDELLHDMFVRRARRGSSDGLRGSILDVTGASAQRPSPLRGLAGGLRPLRLLAVAALVAGTVGAGLLVAGQQRELPAEHSVQFVPQFDFRPVDGVPTSTPILGPGVLAFTVGGPGAQTLAGGGTPGSDVYPLTDAGMPLAGTHGIVFSHLQPGAFVHRCPAGGRVPVRLDQRGLVDDLGAVAGVATDRPTQTSFDGRPAIVVNVDPSRRCAADLHTIPSGLTPRNSFLMLKVPSRLIVTEVDGTTVVIQVWGATPDDLEAWLPAATQFLDGIHFTGQAEQ